jgi:hypothetical protein
MSEDTPTCRIHEKYDLGGFKNRQWKRFFGKPDKL